MPGRPHRTRTVQGVRGALAAAHPLAVAAGVEMLGRGGNAVDAALAAQGVICVTMPHAAGLGGDMLALVREPGGRVAAITGAGPSPAGLQLPLPGTGGGSVTVPGLVDGWLAANRRWGRLPLQTVLSPAAALARAGVAPDQELLEAVRAQRRRLAAGGASEWPLLALSRGSTWRQPQLAYLLEHIGSAGRSAFYEGPSAEAMATAARAHGGSLHPDDLSRPAATVGEPLGVPWGDGQAHVQPPPSQGILLAMALKFLRFREAAGEAAPDDHLLAELTDAVFAFRSSCGRGVALLSEPLTIDAARASRRGGPRANLHTAGVAAADAAGMVVSSLISVFDDFGAGVFVPELGIVLNNRAAGFTDGDNAPAPSKRPVHTLAPALLIGGAGDVLAVATPGADGQVQTLLQILASVRYGPTPVPEAIAAPRWRSQAGTLMIEAGHPAVGELARRGHDVSERFAGDGLFGAVVAAEWRNRRPAASGDWRRQVTAGAA
jgi:gamma-glutamyltranspeptidase / glutathione hydrolase